jgi:hypothetical protein
MSAPLRIETSNTTLSLGRIKKDPKGYAGDIIKLIPAEVVALYSAGRSYIIAGLTNGHSPTPFREGLYWSVLMAFCIGVLVLSRKWLTSDAARRLSPQWAAVAIACVSFLLWVYSLGDIFNRPLGVWDQILAPILLLGWIFLAPSILRLR